MKPNEVRFKPSQSYDIIFRVQGQDYSQEITNIRILSGITVPYPTIIIDLLMDPRDIILNKIYGKDPLKLSIKLLTESNIILDTFNYELLLLRIDKKFSMQPGQLGSEMVDRIPVSFVTIPSISFYIMTSTVNEIFRNESVLNIITRLYQKYNSGYGTIEIDNGKINSDVIDQILIPSMSFYQAIKYIDDNFGIYDGCPIVFSDHLGNIKIKNLSNIIKQKQSFIIYHLGIGEDNTTFIENLSSKKEYEYMYTYTAVSSGYNGNSMFSYMAPNIMNISKPKNKLYKKIEKNITDSFKNLGLISGNDETYLNPYIINDRRINVYNDTGQDDSDHFINSFLAKNLSELSPLTLQVERNIILSKALLIGTCVKFSSRTKDFGSLSGNYILKSTEVNLRRQQDWLATATMNLIRTNQTSI